MGVRFFVTCSTCFVCLHSFIERTVRLITRGGFSFCCGNSSSTAFCIDTATALEAEAQDGETSETLIDLARHLDWHVMWHGLTPRWTLAHEETHALDALQRFPKYLNIIILYDMTWLWLLYFYLLYMYMSTSTGLLAISGLTCHLPSLLQHTSWGSASCGMGTYQRGFGPAFTTSMKLWHLGKQTYCPAQAGCQRSVAESLKSTKATIINDMFLDWSVFRSCQGLTFVLVL